MENLIKKKFPVTGMSCTSCAASVESMLKRQDGIKSASVTYHILYENNHELILGLNIH